MIVLCTIQYLSMLWCMPESDEWALERAYIRARSTDFFEEYLQNVYQYRNGSEDEKQEYRKHKKIFRSAKDAFQRHWKSMGDEGREEEAEQYYEDETYLLGNG